MLIRLAKILIEYTCILTLRLNWIDMFEQRNFINLEVNKYGFLMKTFLSLKKQKQKTKLQLNLG